MILDFARLVVTAFGEVMGFVVMCGSAAAVCGENSDKTSESIL